MGIVRARDDSCNNATGRADAADHGHAPDGERIPSRAAAQRSGSHDQHGEENRTVPVDADVTRPAAGTS